ncbi:hypothetical protein PGT21_013250 [Puccinia graminis f. sp. tritici]|uniref:Uncharacterized protein n=1 Tax=Puccinia graminis f. sp. tritici TaxID=56615 RepID=A0A5B0QMW6_PUCGR|nr:hypothetical protein PGT21_013250 [Puccinia graminis f. sp. tritici]
MIDIHDVSRERVPPILSIDRNLKVKQKSGENRGETPSRKDHLPASAMPKCLTSLHAPPCSMSPGPEIAALDRRLANREATLRSFSYTRVGAPGVLKTVGYKLQSYINRSRRVPSFLLSSLTDINGSLMPRRQIPFLGQLRRPRRAVLLTAPEGWER